MGNRGSSSFPIGGCGDNGNENEKSALLRRRCEENLCYMVLVTVVTWRGDWITIHQLLAGEMLCIN